VRDPSVYLRILERVFGYNIEIEPEFQDNPDEQIRMLATLGEASLAILDYFDSIIEGDDILDAVDTFHTFFAYNPSPDGTQTQIVVRLGADTAIATAFGIPPEDAAYQGNVPLSGTSNEILLGSEVNVATIVHEFGHQLDRWFRRSGLLGSQDQISNLLRSGVEQELLPIDEGAGMLLDLIYDDGIQGFAAKQLADAELWADLFMTAVLSGTGYEVYSILPDWVDEFIEAGREAIRDRQPLPFWDCFDPDQNEGNATCDYASVDFANDDLRSYINTVIRYLLSLTER
jgi:hypothetical protein